MSKNDISKFVRFLPIGIVFVVWYLIVNSNYLPDTFLSGWDNLHPEFNIALNIKRSLSVAWQEYQGVGLLGGMGHAADLPRQIMLLAASLVIPVAQLRYAWVFLMLLIGPLGVYFLIKNVLLASFWNKKNINISYLVSLTASLFYLLNLATVQYFFVPFETFVGFYGFFPWLLYFAIKYLDKGGAKKLIAFFVISVLATGAFYVQTMFVVYVMVLGLFVVEKLIREKKRSIRKVVNLFVVLLAVNAFWLLPSSYFALTGGSSVVENSKINSISTVETQLMNTGFGDPKNIALLKGFWFEYTDMGTNGEFDYLMPVWRVYVSRFNVQVAGIVLFILALIGFVIGVKGKKNVWRVTPLLLFALSYFMLAGGNPPFGSLFNIFSSLPLLGQAFRSVFTKWSVVMAFVYAWGIALFLVYAKQLFVKFKELIVGILALLIVGAGVFMVRPIFEGSLISGATRVDYPSVYFDLFDYFKTQPKQARIAFFPVQTFWGWNNYDWGYRGSGFLWYGIEQPILDRAFDVWNPYNETFYHEVSTSLYGCPAEEDFKSQITKNKQDSNYKSQISNCAEDFKRVLDKYDVIYVLLDESVITPGQDNSILRIPETKAIFEKLGAKITFQQDFLTVYELQSDNTIYYVQGDSLYVGGGNSFVYAPDTYSLKSGDTRYSRSDPLFEGSYIASGKSTFYPMANLYKEKLDGVSYTKEDQITTVNLEREIEDIYGQELVVPGLNKGEDFLTRANISYDGEIVLVSFDPSVKVGGDGFDLEIGSLPSLVVGVNKEYEQVYVSVGNQLVLVDKGKSVFEVVEFAVGDTIEIKVFENTGRIIDLADKFLEGNVNQCWTREGASGLVNVERYQDSLRIKTQDAAGCIVFNLGEFKESMLSVSLPYRSLTREARPKFCVLRSGEEVDCVHDDVFYSTPSSSDWTTVERQMILEPGGYWIVVSGNASDKRGQVSEIQYRSPVIKNYDLVAGSKYNPEIIWSEILKESRYEMANIDKAVFEIASKKIDVDLTGLGEDSYENCDLFERGEIERNIVKERILYKADNRGAVCNYVYLDNISTNRNYLLRFLGENTKGRALRFYLYNPVSNRNDLESMVASGDFDSTFSILSWPFLDSGNYSLNLETRSFGGEKAENRVDKIVFYQVPTEWLAGWYIEPSGGFGDLLGGDGNNTKILNNLEIGNVKKIGTYKYKVDIEGYGLISLSQGYDTGWVAYENSGFLPLVFGKKLEHVKANGWANGYIVSDQNSDTGTKEIVIVYWPQYLQFVGFTLLLFVPVLILIATKSKKKQYS